MRVLSLINTHSGCCYHRVKIPITYLQQSREISGVPAGLSFEESLSQCDILFYNRVPTGYTLDSVLAYRDRYGFRIVVDLDDYWNLYPGHFLEQVWRTQRTDQELLRNITAADAVTCTTDRLRAKILPYNENTHVVPNALPYGDIQFTGARAPGERMRFIYAGGSSHMWDVRLLQSCMNRLARERFSGEIVLAGFSPGVDIYRRMADVMSARGRISRFRSLMYQPLHSYMDLYNDGDVALAPLVPNEFNAHKSNLKVLEAGCKRMPIIVSNTGPYAADPCPHLLRVDTPSEWYKWVRWCEQNPNHVEDNGSALHEWVREHHHIAGANARRLEAFKSVL